MRKHINYYGSWPRKVRVFTDDKHVVVTYREGAAGATTLRTKSWPNSPANRELAKVFAKAVSEGDVPTAPPTALTTAVPITMRDLWEKFSEDQFPALRPRTQALYREYWDRWEIFIGADFDPEKVTRDKVNGFKAGLIKLELKISTIRHTIAVAKTVFNWAELNDLIQLNKLRGYTIKVAKKDRSKPPEEYTGDEFDAIMQQLDPTKATQWRPWCALQICGNQGARQNAVLHLRWSDVRMADVGPDTITWVSEYDKVGREWVQPIRAGTRKALEIAEQWRNKRGYTGPWVLFSGSKKNKAEVYSIQSLHSALCDAEKRADVIHKDGRGGHGLRRMLSNNVRAETGDAALALQAIGDTDMRMANRYLQPRLPEITAAFARLDEAEQKDAERRTEIIAKKW